MDILKEVLDFKEVKYKSDAINSITAKDLDKFLFSMKCLIMVYLFNKIFNFIENKIFNLIHEKFDEKNIMLENFLFKKEI